MSDSQTLFSNPRLKELFESLLKISTGEYHLQIPISKNRDDIDAISHAINVIVGELHLAKEQALKADQNKTQFLANVSHELRSPLAVILGYLSLSFKKNNAAKAQLYLERMHSSSQHLLALVDQLLNLAQIESGKLEYNKSTFNWMEELEDIADQLRHQVRDRDILIVLQISTDENLKNIVNIESDKMKIKQVLLNLGTNAVKFTEKGKVIIKGHLMMKEQLWLDVEIHDTGIGISEESRATLFEPFNRGKAANGKIEGFGLGLSIAKSLTERLNGSVRLLGTEPGMGTSFSFQVPVEAGESQQAAVQINKSLRSSSKVSLKNRLVLIADDSVELLKLTSIIIRSEGAKVVTAKNGHDAVAIALKKRPDLILMDINMPELDGLSATKILRAKNFNAPVVALSAGLVTDKKSICAEAGCEGYLQKPFNESALIQLLVSFLKTREP